MEYQRDEELKCSKCGKVSYIQYDIAIDQSFSPGHSGEDPPDINAYIGKCEFTCADCRNVK